LFFLLVAPAHLPTYPLSLHDALPILPRESTSAPILALSHLVRDDSSVRPSGDLDVEVLDAPICLTPACAQRCPAGCRRDRNRLRDRKSTRLNSSHVSISYAVFCLKKK